MMWILNDILTGFLLYLYFRFGLIVIYEIFCDHSQQKSQKGEEKRPYYAVSCIICYTLFLFCIMVVGHLGGKL